LTCPISSPFPQDPTNLGERLIDPCRDFSELRVIYLAMPPVDPAGGFEPGHGSLEPFNCRFELGHRATVRFAATGCGLTHLLELSQCTHRLRAGLVREKARP